MRISREEFIEIVKVKDYKKLRKCDLTGLDARGLDFSPRGLDYGSFVTVDLTGANFEGCTFEDVDFSCACLRDARFTNAILEGANLSQTDCRGANFSFTSLREANLTDANFEGASFKGTDLSGAFFFGSFLAGANFKAAVLDGQVYLPDESTWSEDNDMARFTDPKHPSFWISSEWDSRYVEEIMRKYKK